MIRVSLLVCSLLFISGCSYTSALNFAGLLVEMKGVDMQLQTGEVSEAITSVPLSEKDSILLANALEEYNFARSMLSGIDDSPLAALNGIPIIVDSHDRMKAAYLTVQDVVDANWDSYSDIDKARMILWRDKAYRLEAAYQEYLAGYQRATVMNEKMQTSLSLLKTVSQIAIYYGV